MSNVTVGSKTMHGVLGMAAATEIGVVQGWDFAAGDTVTISNAGYRDKEFQCKRASQSKPL